jgi:predicted nucleotidyltransferase component of viral defense system
MTRATPPVNLAHSVHDRLLELAKKRARPFNELLQDYAMERFLYRLANSPAHKHFVLKGALLLTACAGLPHRPTRDIDLLGQGDNSEANIRDLLQQACRQTVPADGLDFAPESVATERIKEDADYAGVRVRFVGHLGNARVAMQVDVGFGDVIKPGPRMLTYPVLLDFPAPRLRAYPLETAVAEKFQAMVYLGELNSRMKDFYDVWVLCRHAQLDSARLHGAICATFKRRKTPLPIDPICFSPAFAAAKQVQWRAFLRKLRITDAPDNLATVITDISTTLKPIFTESYKT